ncbi:hypothetical protein DRP04_13625 [Archaeoglobales archaeon]|nr:MAG: hypothetical protein DRO37_08240 [Candidatus Bathyarchaeota archaeon]RLI75297.1 MAG: hypothetical protein DRP04_13625 [Archaeoglobales archaeon]
MGRSLIKTVVDLLLVFGLMAMFGTGYGMYISPSGKFARAAGQWTYLGMEKHTLKDVHTLLGFSMVVVAAVHLALNWRPLLSLVKRMNNSTAIAVVITFVILLTGISLYAFT